MDKDIREFEKSLRDGGLRLAALTRTGRGHFRAVIESPDKRKMVYILANSGSDHRATKNRDKDVKRFFNN